MDLTLSPDYVIPKDTFPRVGFKRKQSTDNLARNHNNNIVKI